MLSPCTLQGETVVPIHKPGRDQCLAHHMLIGECRHTGGDVAQQWQGHQATGPASGQVPQYLQAPSRVAFPLQVALLHELPDRLMHGRHAQIEMFAQFGQRGRLSLLIQVIADGVKRPPLGVSDAVDRRAARLAALGGSSGHGGVMLQRNSCTRGE